MKKKLCTAILAGMISMPTMADFLGVYAGVDYLNSNTSNTYQSVTTDLKDSNNLSGYVAFEHFVPLIPNAKLKYSDLSSEYNTDSSEISGSATNAILYYQLFDNDLFEFDFGLAYTRIETDFNNLNSDLGQAYAAAKVHIPTVGINAFTEVITGSLSDDDATDAQIGLAYAFNPDSLLLNVSLRAGYRLQNITIDNFEQENKGLFVGLEAHF